MTEFFQQRMVKVMAVLKLLPSSIPFESRVEILHAYIDHDRSENQNYVREIAVHRNRIFEDAMGSILQMSNMKHRLHVQFINEFGEVEMGIDSGGLFKEFWTTLSAEAFNPSYGLFKLTEDQNLYPNPDSEIYCGSEHLAMFYFLGRVLGKAIYENIVVDPFFAEFFLRKMLGHLNFAGDIYSLDRELYNSLQSLKKYDGDAQDLCLCFSVTAPDGSEIDLIENGSNVEVTNENKFKYIYYMANYRLNV